MRYKMMLVALDGSTLSNKEGELSDLTIKNLQKAQQKGLTLVLVGSQTIKEMEPIALQLGMNKYGGILAAHQGRKIVKCDTQLDLLEEIPMGMPYHRANRIPTLLKLLNVFPAEVIGVGCNANSLPLMEMSGLGVAMANADECIKACADYVTLSNEKEGISHLLQKYVFSNTFTPASLEQLNAGFEKTLMSSLGITITAVTDIQVKGEMIVDERNRQPFGILHGGATLAFGETLAGIGSRFLCRDGEMAVGMQVSGNHISSAIVGDTVTGIAMLLHRGRSTHIWNIDVFTSHDKLVSSIRVINSILKRR